MRHIKFYLLWLVAMVFLSACEEQQSAGEAPVKAVKTIVIGEARDVGTRTLAGVVQASDESALSFRVGGQITEMSVERGDTVKRGDVLARLQQQDYILALDAAEARLQSARSQLTKAEQSHERYQILVESNAVSRTDAERFAAAYEDALSQVAIAETDVQTAEDNLQRTILRAPFDGQVATKEVENFAEVTVGQTVFLLQGTGDKEVAVSVPETIIRQLQVGGQATVTFPTLEGVQVAATIAEVAVQSGAGNAFPITLKLTASDADIRPGMTAEVKIALNDGLLAILIPTSAVDLRFFDEIDKSEAQVFLVEPASSTLKSVTVTISDISGNSLRVNGGLHIGDRIVVAGVAFLNEGQEVKLWQPQYAVPASLGK